MKKLYTLLFSTMLCVSASAQISLTLDGVNVADKSKPVQIYNTQAKDKIPGMPMLGQLYGLYPEFLLTSQQAQDVVVTIIDNSQDRGTQFCYGTTCDELYKMDYQSTKTAKLEAGKPTDLAIHVVREAATDTPYEVELLINAYGTHDSQSLSSTVTLRYDPNAEAGVESVVAQRNPSIYTLSGQRVAAPARKGIYVVGGRKVVK